jgi:hypothetical protein
MEYTLKNYQLKVAEIEALAVQKKRELVREFAIANNPYKKKEILYLMILEL